MQNKSPLNKHKSRLTINVISTAVILTYSSGEFFMLITIQDSMHMFT